ncbi:MAG: hypothetical protein HRT61_05805 [Ekhidna sp.]|nr:hypothetical protein [Ekhidna sp.]
MSDLLDKYKETRFDQDEEKSYSSEQIQDLIKTGSDKKLGKIKLNIKIEFLLALVFVLIALIMLVLNFFEQQEVLMVAFISTIISAIYFVLYRRIRAISFAHSDIKTSLQQAIHHLEKTMKLYYRITTLSFPTLFFGIYIFLKLHSQKSILPSSSEDWGVLATGIVVSLLLHPFAKWALNHLYRKHIEELKKNLDILKM